METIERKQTAFRLRSDLIARLKIAAKRENRSLNNYVESALLDLVSRQPNEVTLSAMREVKSGKPLETLDVNNFDIFINSL